MGTSERRQATSSVKSVFIALLAVVFLAGACGDSENEDSNQADDSSQNGGGLSVRPEGAGELIATKNSQTDSDLITVKPNDKFQRLAYEQFGNKSTQIFVEDAISVSDSSWLLAGALENGSERTERPVIVSISQSDASADKLTELPLPSGTGNGEGFAVATGLVISGDEIIVVGNQFIDGGSVAVVWSAPSDSFSESADWEVSVLPGPTVKDLSTNSEAESQIVSEKAKGVVAAAGNSSQRLIYGSLWHGGRSHPGLWRSASGGWELVDVDNSDGTSGPKRQSLDGVAIGSDTVVAVGGSIVEGSQPEPTVWQMGLSDEVLVETSASGLPTNGYLADVEVVDKQGSEEFLALGGSLQDGVAEPLVASALNPSGRWKTNSPSLDIGTWISFSGFGFNQLEVVDKKLFATLDSPVIQQLYISDDSGQTWDRQGDLSYSSGTYSISNGLAVDSGGTALVAGADLVMQRSASRWNQVVDSDTVPFQAGTAQAISLQSSSKGFFVGGVEDRRSAVDYLSDAVIWHSPDGLVWKRSQLTNSNRLSIGSLAESSDGEVVAIKQGRDYLERVSVERQNEAGEWKSFRLDIPPADLTTAVSGAQGAVIAAGAGTKGGTLEPIFLLIEDEGKFREIPLTSSPVEGERINGQVDCIGGEVGGLFAVLSWGADNFGVALSQNGERWAGVKAQGLSEGLEISGCGGTKDKFLIGGINSSGDAVIVESSDGTTWTETVVSNSGSVNGIAQLGEETFLYGQVRSESGAESSAAIWRREGDGWKQLQDTGLEADNFARSTSVTGLSMKDGLVVAIGTDRGRAGVWIADESVLVG